MFAIKDSSGRLRYECATIYNAMSASEPQITEPQEFIGLDDYAFNGDTETVDKKREFIRWYRIKGNVFHAAQAARIARASVYRWLERDPVFATAMADSFEDCADTLESSVFERAFKSDLLAMFWLKAHRPKFRDKVAIDVPAIQNAIKQYIDKLRMAGMAVMDSTMDSSPATLAQPQVKSDRLITDGDNSDSTTHTHHN